MSNDTRTSEQPSMIARVGTPSTEVPSATERAQALRANLSGMRDVDTLLAEANRLRRDAAIEADQLVAEAQALSAELLSEAEEQAATILAAARTEAEAARSRAAAVLEQVETGVRHLGGHLEGALGSVTSLTRTFEEIRRGDAATPEAGAGSVDEEPVEPVDEEPAEPVDEEPTQPEAEEPAAPVAAPAAPAPERRTSLVSADRPAAERDRGGATTLYLAADGAEGADGADEYDVLERRSDSGARPLGWLFRATPQG